MQTCQDQSPEASKASAVIDVDGMLLTCDVQPGHLTIATVPPGGLTVLGATIQHVEGESQADARVRLAVALMESLTASGEAIVTVDQHATLIQAVPRWAPAEPDRSELLRRQAAEESDG